MLQVNGVLTQDCDKKGPSGSGKDNKDGKHDHGNGQKANNGGKKPNDGKDRSQKQEPRCEDNLISMQMKMEALRSDNERIKRKLGDYERKLAFFDDSGVSGTPPPYDQRGHTLTCLLHRITRDVSSLEVTVGLLNTIDPAPTIVTRPTMTPKVSSR